MNYSCLFCNAICTAGRSKTNKYCSNICQQAYQSKIRYEQVEAGNATNSDQVKRYLLQKHGNVCLSSDCAWDFSKKSINVELEHIDGNGENNTLANCTLLCPNCHSTTPTYKAKNKGNGRVTRRIKQAATTEKIKSLNTQNPI